MSRSETLFSYPARQAVARILTCSFLFHAAKLESDPAKYWDRFYGTNEDRFFRDRHYFDREFPEIRGLDKGLEVGCGAGNATFALTDMARQIYA